MKVLMAIDSVLNEEKMSSTYKIALVNSLVDYVIEHPGHQPKNGFHFIPLIEIARNVLYYYYPMAWYSENKNYGIKQTSNKNLAIFTSIHKLITKLQNKSDKVYTSPEGIFHLRNDFDCNTIVSSHLLDLLISIRKTLLLQPLRYIKIKGSILKEEDFQGFEIKQKQFALFGLYNQSLNAKDNQNYETIRTSSLKFNQKTDLSTWMDLINCEDAFIIMGDYTYAELVSSRLYIRDAIIKRWIEYSVDTYRLSGKATLALIEALSLRDQIPERASGVIQYLRKIAKELFNPMNCMYCTKPISVFELDHLIPWSKYPTNYFWNLYPACKECNSKKSDKVLTIDLGLQKRIKEYLEKWLTHLVSTSDAQKFGGQEFNLVSSNSINYQVEYLVDQLELISKDIS